MSVVTLKHAANPPVQKIRALGTVFDVIDVLGDGSCFYHCMYKALHPVSDISDEEYNLGVSALRGRTAKEIEENWEDVKGFIETRSRDAYLDGVRTTAWADDIQIQSFLNSLNKMNNEYKTYSYETADGERVNYDVLNTNNHLGLVILKDNTNNSFDPVCEKINDDAGWFLFLRYTGDHYQLLRMSNKKTFVISRSCVPLSVRSALSMSCPTKLIIEGEDCDDSVTYKWKL